MAENDNVQVTFGAQITGLVAGVKEAQAEIKGFGEQVEGMTSLFTGFAEAAAAAFAIDEIKEFIRETTELGVDLTRMEEQLGMTANEINVLAFAAENSDTKMAMLTRSITQFDRMTQEARDGTTHAADAFRAVMNDATFSVQKFLDSGHSMADLFRLTTEKLSQYTNSQEKSADVALLFGGRSSQLISVLNELGGHYGELSQAVQRSGATVEGFDKTSEETQKILTEMDGATKGLTERLYMAFNPAIKDVESTLLKGVEAFNAWIDRSNALRFTIDGIVQSFKLLGTTWDIVANSVMTGIAELEVSFFTLGKVIKDSLTGHWGAIKTDMKEGTDELLELNAEYAQKNKIYAQEGANAIKKVYHDLTDDLEKHPIHPTVDGGESGEKIPGFIDTGANKKLMDEDIANHKSMLDRELEDDGENLRARMQHAQQYYDWLKSKYPENVRAMNDASRKISEIQNQEIRKEEQNWNQFFSTFHSGLMGMLRGTTTFRQGMMNIMAGVAENWIKNLEKIAAKWISTEMVKTEATNVGNAARTASDKTAAAASGGFSATNAIKTITGDAAKAYAGTYGFLAPEMGPLAAIPAGVAFAAVMGMEALVPSFDVGAWNIPHDMTAKLHAGERVMTAEENRSYSANGGGGKEIHMNFYGPTDKAYFMANSHHIAAALGVQARNFNSTLSKAKT
jgi:hypothetical protein